MNKYGIMLTVPGGPTVGSYGGWTAGGGHNFRSSIYGHGADQMLAFQVVTADGRYKTVTPDENPDLFHAMLGGGGSMWYLKDTQRTKNSVADRTRYLRRVDLGHCEGLPSDSVDDHRHELSSDTLPVAIHASHCSHDHQPPDVLDRRWAYQRYTRKICDSDVTHYSRI